MSSTRRSLIIGVNAYRPAIGKLKFCTEDARAIENALNSRKDGYNSTKSTLLIDTQSEDLRPSKVNIIENIAEICAESNDEDTLIIHFSGHGAIGVNKKLYLLPLDASAVSIEQTGIPWSWIQECIESSKARNKVLILDACHSGTGKNPTINREKSLDIANQLIENTEGFVCISSCAGGQLSYELEDLNHGLFTYYLVEGIKGGADALNIGVIDIESLFNYASENTAKHAKKIKVQQTPFIFSKLSGSLKNITITVSSLEHPIDKVLVLTEDPIVGTSLVTGIQMSPSANDAKWVRDLQVAMNEADEEFMYNAICIDIRKSWDLKKEFMLKIRNRYPIVPFVLVGSREEFLASLGKRDREIYSQYFFLDIGVSIGDLFSYLSRNLRQVEWDIRSKFGERIFFDK